jgi:pimeloyl-ACP methyl ester carboxylesterase
MTEFFTKIIAKTIGQYISFLSYVYPKQATHLAYRFFSEPRAGKLQPNALPEILKKATRETLTVNDEYFEVYYWIGNGQPILLLHGWESNASRWEPLLPYLQQNGNTIIALDGPAHGLSKGKEFNVPKFASFVNKVVEKYQPKTIIGHSIGGSTCLFFHYHYQPKNIEKMVLLGAPSDLEILINNYAKILGLNSKVVELLEKYFVKKFRMNFSEFSGKRFSSYIDLEGFISHDKSDNVVHFEEAIKIISAWKKGVLVETNGLGHSMHDHDLYLKVQHFLFTS